MRNSLPLVIGLLVLSAAAPAAAVDCDTVAAAAIDASTLVAPAPGLDATAVRMQAAGLGESAADLSAAAVLQRMRADACLSAPPSPADGYQKRTEFDNTPYRYNMQSGKFNAAEFEAWMASRGIRIVRANNADTADAVQVAADSAAPVNAAGTAAVEAASGTVAAPVVAQ